MQHASQRKIVDVFELLFIELTWRQYFIDGQIVNAGASEPRAVATGSC